jgi:hypothetical protein
VPEGKPRPVMAPPEVPTWVAHSRNDLFRGFGETLPAGSPWPRCDDKESEDRPARVTPLTQKPDQMLRFDNVNDIQI